MTKEQLIEELSDPNKGEDSPLNIAELHCKMDRLLLRYINDPRVTALYDSVDKEYGEEL